jgi:porin
MTTLQDCRAYFVSGRLRLLPRLALAAAFIAALATLAAGPVSATPPPVAPAPQPDASGAPGSGGAVRGFNRQSSLFGDLFGIRKALSKKGVTLTASETSEELGNLGGGVRRGFVYDGLTQMDLQADLSRSIGLYGGTLNLSALQVHGHSLSAENLDTLQTASGIEADQTSRVWELWYQQLLNRENTLDVKIGQQSLDQEFIVNQNSLLFVNTMFGWPMLPSADLPSGGPAYPLSALGVRLRARPAPAITLLAGVFNGNPAPTTIGDSQRSNPSGLSFPLNGGVLAIGELQYITPVLGGITYADRPQPLARTVKVGFAYDSEKFPDLAIDDRGLPLASPNSSGNPVNHQGNYFAYATIDQEIAQNKRDPYKILNGFVRAMGTPLGNENLIAFSIDSGLTLHEPIKRRRDDTIGLAMGYTKVGSGAAQSDAFTGQYGGGFYPVRNGETFFEATYQYQYNAFIQLQPDFQYTLNPGANLPNPNSPNRRIGNEPIIGLRTIIQL